MTIVVGIAAPDGLILAGDGRTTAQAPNGRSRIVSDTAQKVFAPFGKFGVATYGAAILQEKTVSGQMDEFEATLSAAPEDVHAFVKELGDHFQNCVTAHLAAAGTPWKPGDPWSLGFLVGGYDNAGVGHLFDVRVPGDGGPEIIPSGPSTTNIGPTFRGQDDVINRLLAGVDAQRLAQSGVTVPPDVEKALSGLEYNILRPVTMQDAIDFATFLIRTTIDMQRFSDGTIAVSVGLPGCGGQLRVLGVTPRGVQWIARAPLRVDSRPGSAEGAIG